MPSIAPSRLISTLRASAAASVFALAALTSITGHASAQALGLNRVGPVDPATKYPLFYEDTTGLRLGLCRDVAACGFLLPDPLQPAHYPQFPGDAINWPAESFYWSATGSMLGTGTARVTFGLALEGAFLGGGPVAFEQNIVFTRTRLRITGLVDGATYTITHPFGTMTLVAGVDGPLPGTINVTNDVGIGSAMDFQAALHGDIGPFLLPVGFVGPGFPGQMLSDGATETLVTGSPLNTNFLRIQGPNANLIFPANARGNNRAQVDTFVIVGQVAQQLGAGVDRVTVDKTATGSAVNIWASTAPSQSLAVALDGGPSVPMQGGAIDGFYFARMVLPAGAALPGLVSVTNTTDFPATTFPGSNLFDTVEILGATFNIGGDLVVNARSSDKTGATALTLIADGFAPTLLPSLGNGSFGGNIAVPPGLVPPKTVRVESSMGGSADANVVIAGAGAQGTGVPLIANAGLDQTVQSGALVSLSGLLSSGNIAGYSWTHNAGAQIALLGGNTATPSFSAPAVGINQQLDIQFSLLVFDGVGGAAIDTMIVHVLGPVGPLDVVTITDARLSVAKGGWRVLGSNSLHQGQQVKVYLGAIGDRSRQLATVPVTATGAWSYIGGTPAGVTILATDTTVWAESTLIGTPGSFAIRRL